MIFTSYFTTKMILIILIIIFIVIIFMKKKYDSYYYSIQHSKTSLEYFIKYLDGYYITNMYYTLFAVGAHIIGNISVIFILRFYINKKNNLNMYPIDSDALENINVPYFNYLNVIGSIILFIITIIIYKKMLEILFYKEIVKLHIYLSNNDYYFNISQTIDSYYFDDLLEKLSLFLYNIWKLKQYSTSADEDTLCSSEHDIYDNTRILSLSKILVSISTRYKYFNLLSKILFQLTYKFLYRFLRTGFIRYIPHIVYLSLVFYDFTQLKIYYSYYAFIPFYICLLSIECIIFLETKDALTDSKVNKYFYENDYEYKKQRMTHNMKDNQNNNNLLTISSQNRKLFSLFTVEYMKIYVLNNFYRDYNKINEDLTNILKQVKHITKKYYYITLLSIGVFYTMTKYNTYFINIFYLNIRFSLALIVGIIYIILLYCCINIVKPPINKIDYFNSEYTYNKYYKRIYWILVFILLLLLCFVIIKGTLLIIIDGILWEYKGIQIIKIYSMEDKIIFFHKYFNHCIEINKWSGAGLTTIQLFISELDLKNIFLEETTFKEIKIYIGEIFSHYNDAVEKYNMILLTEIANREKYLSKLQTIRSYMDCITNIANFICFYKFIAQGLFLSRIRNPITIHFVAKWFILIVKYLYKNR